ncbi:MAG TPA: cyclic nucleotide-binding domain-containing protein [Spirochaetia bacterium]|nr:cyclic nucleotide-binding domain-containing protein [Spirochaetia bacterium]
MGPKTSQYISKLRKSMIFRFLSDDSLSEVLKIARVLNYKKDEIIIAEGEISPYLFSVLEGSVDVSVKKPEGEDLFVCVLGEGDVFGEAAIFLKVKRTATVTSKGIAALLRIHRQDFFNFIKERPSDGNKILMIMIHGMLKKLKDANQELAFEGKTVLEQGDLDEVVESMVRPG